MHNSSWRRQTCSHRFLIAVNGKTIAQHINLAINSVAGFHVPNKLHTACYVIIIVGVLCPIGFHQERNLLRISRYFVAKDEQFSCKWSIVNWAQTRLRLINLKYDSQSRSCCQVLFWINESFQDNLTWNIYIYIYAFTRHLFDWW